MSVEQQHQCHQSAAACLLISITSQSSTSAFHAVSIPYIKKYRNALPSLPSPSPLLTPLRSRPPSLRLEGLGERSSSPSGFGQSPATKRLLVHFQPIWMHFLASIFKQFVLCKITFPCKCCLRDTLCIQSSKSQVVYLHANFSGYYKSTDYTKWKSKRPTR